MPTMTSEVRAQSTIPRPTSAAPSNARKAEAKSVSVGQRDGRTSRRYRTGRRRRGSTMSAPFGTRPASASDRVSSASSAPRNLST